MIVFGDQRYSLWRTDGSGLVNRVLPRSDSPFIAGYTADGSRLLLEVEDDDGPAVEIIDASTGEVVDRFAGASMVHPTHEPDLVIMWFADGTVGWYDLAPAGRPAWPSTRGSNRPTSWRPPTEQWRGGSTVRLVRST